MREMTRTFFRQKPVKGGRDPLPACVLREIWVEVERQARRFGVSRSFVVATALAHTFGLEAEDYRTVAADRARAEKARRRNDGRAT